MHTTLHMLIKFANASKLEAFVKSALIKNHLQIISVKYE